MKKITFMLLSAVVAFAMSASQSYVDGLKSFINDKSFPINGKFYKYDFEHDGQIQANNWLYIDTNSGAAFQLLGNTPTQDNPFAWKPLATIPSDLNVNNPSGYFIFINYPQDMSQFGTNAFSWLYVVNGRQMVFKLMAAKPDHSFDYLDENGDGAPDPLSNISYTISDVDKSITFHWNNEGGFTSSTSSNQSNNSSSSTTAQENLSDFDSISTSCTNHTTLTISNGLTTRTVETTVNSGYSGKVIYDCKFTQFLEGWGLLAPITITQIEKIEKIFIDGTTRVGHHMIVQATTVYNYKKGTVSTYSTTTLPEGDSTYECTQQYTSPLPKQYSPGEEYDLKILLQDWGTIPDESLISSECSGTASPINISTIQYDPQFKQVILKRTTYYRIYDTTGQINRVKIETHQTVQ